ncbi:MAG: tryptophan-rich sensory protein [Clostridia bacterium]|nr:tryptophan-rich sensory protein [Clostridia bacterium]
MSKPSCKQNKALSTTGIILGVFFALIFIGVRILSPSPYETIYRLDPSDILPALWILNLITFIWFFLIGYSAGTVADSALYCNGSFNDKLYFYQGSTAFTICFFLSHVSYSTFFGGKHLFAAILMVLIAVICSAATMILWAKIRKGAALIMGGYSIWLLYFFITYSNVALHV